MMDISQVQKLIMSDQFPVITRVNGQLTGAYLLKSNGEFVGTTWIIFLGLCDAHRFSPFIAMHRPVIIYEDMYDSGELASMN